MHEARGDGRWNEYLSIRGEFEYNSKKRFIKIFEGKYKGGKQFLADRIINIFISMFRECFSKSFFCLRKRVSYIILGYIHMEVVDFPEFVFHISNSNKSSSNIGLRILEDLTKAFYNQVEVSNYCKSRRFLIRKETKSHVNYKNLFLIISGFP